MPWSGYGSAIFIFRGIKRYLPLRLQRVVEKELYSDSLTKSQMESIAVLGEKVGLNKSEIFAAVPSGMNPAGFGERRRMTLFSAIVSIVIIILGSFLFMVLIGNYPPEPVYTYTPGTRYGSISPDDFN